MWRITPLPRSNLVRLLKFLGSLILSIRMRYGVRRFCAPVWHHRLKTAWDCFFLQGVVGLGVIRGVHASASLKRVPLHRSRRSRTCYPRRTRLGLIEAPQTSPPA